MCQGSGQGSRGLAQTLAWGGEHLLERAGGPVLVEDTGWTLLPGGHQEAEAMHQMLGEGSGDQGRVCPGPCAQCHIKEDLLAAGCRKAGRQVGMRQSAKTE